MYRCQVCKKVSQPREPRKVHVIHRVNSLGHQEIAREIPVCAKCQVMLHTSTAIHASPVVAVAPAVVNNKRPERVTLTPRKS